MSQFNGLTPSESERIYILLEECGEVQHIIGKILRHGYESTHPEGGPTNRNRLESELGDVLYALSMLYEAKDIDNTKVFAYTKIKKGRIQPYLHHQ